jgi:hypothetical protein
MLFLDSQAVDPSPPDDGPSFAEPPAMLPGRDVDEWLCDLEFQLATVEVIRVIGPEWLRPDDLRRRIDALLHRLEMRGIRIERPT